MGAIKEIKHWAIPECCCGLETTETAPTGDYVPKDWLLNYSELKLETLKASSGDGRTCQGGCTDGDYIYRALIDVNSALTTLQKINKDTGEVVMSVTETSYTHANDMCYCAKDGYLYIAHGSENNTLVSRVNRTTLKEVDRITIPSGIWSIAYNAEDDVFIVGISGGYYFTVYTYDWEIVYRLRPHEAPYGYVKQSITCDSNYIYAGYYRGDGKGSMIYIFTWNGMFIKRFIIAAEEHELEFVDRIGDKFYIGFYDGRDNSNLRFNHIATGTFDIYEGASGSTLRPTDVEGGLNALQRLPDGSEVCVWRGSAKSGTLKCQNKITRNAFRSYKIVAVGHNQFTSEWFKGGRCKVTEFNLDDAVGELNIDYKECIMEYDLETNSFTIVTNVTQKQYINAEGVITTAKGTLSNNPNDLSIIEITQIWGIV